MTQTNSATVSNELDSLYQRLLEAEQQIASGVTIDLADVPSQVEDICRALLALPPEETTAAIPRLQKLVEDLDALGIKITQAD